MDKPETGVRKINHTHKHITKWIGPEQLEANGFVADVIGSQASVGFGKDGDYEFIKLDVMPSYADQYIASRITEGDKPTEHCWKPTDHENIIMEFTARFARSISPCLTENLGLWNATLRSITAAGVSRNVLSDWQYVSIVAQDFSPLTNSGLVHIVPMPEWLNATTWHHVKVVVSLSNALIEVSQDEHPYTLVQQTNLLMTPGPLGCEFSADNEIIPGQYGPITMSDSIDIAHFEIMKIRL